MERQAYYVRRDRANGAERQPYYAWWGMADGVERRAYCVESLPPRKVYLAGACN